MHRTASIAISIFLAAVAAGQTDAERAAQKASDILAEVSIGFQGNVLSSGVWPMIVTLTNQTKTPIEIEIVVDGPQLGSDERTSIERRTEITPGASRRIEFVNAGGRLRDRSMTLRTAVAKSYWFKGPGFDPFAAPAAREVTLPLRPKSEDFEFDTIIPVLGGRALQIENGISPTTTRRGYRYDCIVDGRFGRFVACDPLLWPSSALALADIPTIIWTEPEPQAFESRDAYRALLRWVECGGRLIVLTAHRSDIFADPEVAELLALDYSGTREVAYGRFLPRDLVSGIVGPKLEFRPEKSFWQVVPGNAKDWPSDLPVRLDRRLGLGRVSVLLVDPLKYDRGDVDIFATSFAGITGLDIDYAEGHFEKPTVEPALRGDVFYDLLENKNVVRPPLSVFFMMALFYVWAIGYFDFRILSKHRRLRMSPFTLLAYAALFTIICLVTAALIFGKEVQTNRIAFVDLFIGDDGGERARGLYYHGIYSPFGGTYDAAPVDPVDCWAEPAPHYRGEVLKKPTVERQYCDVPGQQTIRPYLPVNTFRSIESRVVGTPPRTIDVNLSEIPDKEFAWEIVVKNGLNRPLREGLFVWGGGSIPIKDVAPGATLKQKIGKRAPRTGNALGTDDFASRIPQRFTLDMVAEQKRPSDAPIDDSLLGALYIGSLPRRLATLGSRLTTGRVPWDLTSAMHLRFHGCYLAVTDDPVFDQRIEADGFSYVVVRRIVDLPRR